MGGTLSKNMNTISIQALIMRCSNGENFLSGFTNLVPEACARGAQIIFSHHLGIIKQCEFPI